MSCSVHVCASLVPKCAKARVCVELVMELKPAVFVLCCLQEGDYSAAELTEALLHIKVSGCVRELLQHGQKTVVSQSSRTWFVILVSVLQSVNCLLHRSRRPRRRWTS